MRNLTLLFAMLFASVAGVWADVPGNLALNKTAIATSATANHPASNAVDGDPTTRWESASYDPQTLQIDLGEDKTFRSIVIVWETACSKDFSITAHASDGATFTDGYLDNGTEIYSVTDNTTSGKKRYTQIIKLDAATVARYVKLHSTARDTQYGNSIYEFYILEDENPTPIIYSCNLTVSQNYMETNGSITLTVDDKRDQFGGAIDTNPDLSIALGGGTLEGTTYTAPSTEQMVVLRAAMPNGRFTDVTVDVVNNSSIQAVTENNIWIEEGCQFSGNDGQLSNAFDDNYANDWVLHAPDGENKNYESGFVIDLKGTYNIKRIIERYENSCPADYTIAFSADGVSYTTVKTVASYSQSTPADIFNRYMNDARAIGIRYIRFHCSRASLIYGVKVRRFEILAEQVTTVSDDATGPVFANEPTTTVAARTATVKLDATDATGNYLYYTVKEMEPATGEAQTFRFTTMQNGNYSHTISGLSPQTQYTYQFVAYDIFGNASEAKNVTFETGPVKITKIQGTVDKPNSEDKDIAEQIFAMNSATTTKPVFTIIDEDGNTVAENTTDLDIKYVILHDDLGILSTDGLSTVAVENTDMPYNTNGVFNIVANHTGTAVIRIIATYKNGVGGVAVGHYGISVFNPALTLTTFTVLAVNDGTDTYTKQEDGTSPISGTHGNLKKIINDRLTAAGNGKTYMDVTDITIEGTLDTRDLRTLREMGGVKFNVTANSKGFTAEQMAAHPYYFENDEHLNNYRGHYGEYGGTGTQGNLHTLNLANATFTVVSMDETKTIHEDQWNNLSEDKKIALNQNDNVLVTLPVEEDENTWDFVDWRNTGNLHNINQFAFMGCVNLEEVTLPNVSNLMIGMHAFEHCENLQKVHNMDKVTWFADYSFNQDKSLVGGNSAHVNDGSKVEFSSDLTYIGYVAFQNCESMKLYSRHLPDNINHIGDQAFASCKGFDSYIVYPNNPSLDIAHMATGVFLNCSNLQQVYIPSTTVTFGYMEFQGCSKLTDVNFYNAGAPAWTTDAVADEKPTAINETAYSANLVNVIANAFADCVALKDENFKRLYNTKLIGSTAFAGCKLMTDESFNTLIKHFCDGNDQDNKAAGNGKVLSNDPSLCDYTVPYRAFHGCDNLTTVDFNQCENTVKRIDTEAFSNCDNITTVVLPVALTSMGDIVFANCTALQTVTVQNSVAPTMDHETLTYETIVKNEQNEDVVETRQANIFLNTPSEKVEIIFPEALKTANDASGYKTYRANAHFMNAMTRTVNDSGTEYNVAPQFGGDFKLTRSFTAGWNTLALPFGSPATGKDINGVAKFKAAFEDANFDHISTYRGRKGETFMFMKMDDEDALADFEPVMVKLKNPVTSEITFTDVDINYNHSTKALIQPNAMTINTVSLASDDDYSSVGQLANLADDFKFTGTYKVLLNASKEDMTYIKDGDYIIQTNNGMTTFVKCETGKRYGLKAFRGWFQANSSNPRSALMNIMDFNVGEGITNEIGTIDTATGEITTAPQDIYTINGQLVRKGATSTNGLSKGIYIMGGRKIVVK